MSVIDKINDDHRLVYGRSLTPAERSLCMEAWKLALESQWVKKEAPDSEGNWLEWDVTSKSFKPQEIKKSSHNFVGFYKYPQMAPCLKGIWYKIQSPPKPKVLQPTVSMLCPA